MRLVGGASLDELVRVGPARKLNVQQLLRALEADLARVDGEFIVPVAGGGAANTTPIFTLTPNIGTVAVSAALTKSDGTATAIGTDIFKAWTAGANGAFAARARWNPVATTAATTTTATIGRIYLSSLTSGATTGGTNTWLLGEVTLASVSADSSSAPTVPIEIMLNMPVPAGWTILASTHAAPAANSSWQAMVIGGDY